MKVHVHRKRAETLLTMVGFFASASAGKYVSVMRSGEGKSAFGPPSCECPDSNKAGACKPITIAHAAADAQCDSCRVGRVFETHREPMRRGVASVGLADSTHPTSHSTAPTRPTAPSTQPA